jgi:predicted dehydrogenase
MAPSPGTRIGVVGLGQMGRYHTQAYRAVGADIVGVCDTDPERAAAFGAEHGLPSCTSFDELLATPGLTAVSICTPPHLHLPMVRAALEAGLDVLCEKPLASTLRDGRTLAGFLPPDRIVMLCFFHRFHEPIVRLRTMLAAGELGTPQFMRNRFALDMRADRRPWVWDPARAGGGAVLNTSVHSIDLFRFLIGEPLRVAARMRPTPTEVTLEHDAVLLLEGAPGGPTAVLEAASYAVEREYALTLETDQAVAEVGWNPPSLRIRRHADDRWTEVSIAASSSVTRIQSGIDHFLSCVAERRQPHALMADGVRALEVAEAAYRSVAEDRFVACGPGGSGGPADPGQAI